MVIKKGHEKLVTQTPPTNTLIINTLHQKNIKPLTFMRGRNYDTKKRNL